MPFIIVSEAAATAIFTITRLLYDSVLGVVALILFSKLPGGSSAKFWYEQPDIVAKVTSLFHPFGPTGKRGVKFTNAIAMLCTIAAVALNIVPTILSKMSPINNDPSGSVMNSTLSPIQNIFIPTLTDINLPGLSNPATSINATNKFLCTHVANGCRDSKNLEIARINWDHVVVNSTAMFHLGVASNSLSVAINDTFGSATTPQQYMFLAKQALNSSTTMPVINTTSITRWADNTLTGIYVIRMAEDSDGDSVIPNPYDLLGSDQIYPLQTPDLADLLRQGRNPNAPMPSNGNIDRAERWVAIHRTETLSSLLWQAANAHEGKVDSTWQATCFLCSLLNLPRGSPYLQSIQQSLLASLPVANARTYAIRSYPDTNYRLTTMLCLLRLDASTGGLSYHCLHTYSQIWSISHESNPYTLNGNYNDLKTAADLGNYGTPFPLFPPPTNLTTNRTYFPIVPIFQIRSKGKCDTDWNPQVETIQSWSNKCAVAKFAQVDPVALESIAKNFWQLTSTITVGGFLINATYFTYEVGIKIDTPVIVVVLASLVLAIISNIVLNLVTSPIHRRSLYEAVRIMVPDSRDPYNVQKVILNIAPTNTLRLVDSMYDKRVSYLKLNNRLLVAMSEEQNITDDTTTIDNVNTDNPSPIEIQNWSRRQLLKF